MAFLAKTYHDYGMARDTDVAVGKDTLAYENFNIRITARDRETLLSVTNDRGNVRVMPERWLVLWNDPDGKDRTQGFSIVSAADYNKEHEEDSGFVPQDTELHLMGTVIGYNVLNNYVTLFTTEGEGLDHIYRVEYVPGGEPSEWRGLELLSGDCGFDAGMPIETLGDYENDDVLKVYWLDGVNQPRVINISDRNITENGIGDWTKIDFVAEFSPTLKVTVEKVYEGTAVFGAGIVQYVFTYGNKHGQQSNIVHVSPVYYASPSGRGGSPEESVNCQFRITVSGFDTTWRWLNVYRLMQTSESGQWTADRVARLDVGDVEAVYTDDGSSAESVDPAEMLYVGGRELSAYTMCAKDQTLFLGNLRMLTTESDPEIIEAFAAHRDGDGYSDYLRDEAAGRVGEDGETPLGLLRFEYADAGHCIPYTERSGYYPYSCQLDFSGEVIRTFKAGEKYRIGMRFVTKAGTRTGVYWVGDVEQTLYPYIDLSNSRVDKACLKCAVPSDLVKALDGKGYVQAELMMAERAVSDRCVQAQGIVAPTVFNLVSRVDDAPYAMASWYMRPRMGTENGTRIVNRHFDCIPKNDSMRAEIQCVNSETTAYASVGEEARYTHKIWVLTASRDKSSETNIYVKVHLYYGKRTSDGYEWGKRYDTYSKDRGRANTSDLASDVVNYLSRHEFPSVDKGTVHSFLTHFKRKGYGDNDKDADVLNGNPVYYAYWLERHLNGDDTLHSTDTVNLFSAYRNDEEKETVRQGGVATEFRRCSIPLGTYGADMAHDYARRHANNFFVDENVCTFNTPELTDGTYGTFENANMRFRIVGLAKIGSNITDYSIDVGNFADSSNGVAGFNISNTYHSDDADGLLTFPLYRGRAFNEEYYPDDGWKAGTNLGYENTSAESCGMWIYPWHKTGSLTYRAQGDTDDSGSLLDMAVRGEDQDVLKTKTESNLRFSLITRYLWGDRPWGPSGGLYPLKVFNSDEETVKQIETAYGTRTYKGNYDMLLSCAMSNVYETDSKDSKYGVTFDDYDYGYKVYDTGTLDTNVEYETLLGSSDGALGENKACLYKKDTFGHFYDPVDITVKSTPHIVLAFMEGEGGAIVHLPDIYRPDADTSGDSDGEDSRRFDFLEQPESDDGGETYLPWDCTIEGYDGSLPTNTLALDVDSTPAWFNPVEVDTSDPDEPSFTVQMSPDDWESLLGLNGGFDTGSDSSVYVFLIPKDDELRSFNAWTYKWHEIEPAKISRPYNTTLERLTEHSSVPAGTPFSYSFRANVGVQCGSIAVEHIDGMTVEMDADGLGATLNFVGAEAGQDYEVVIRSVVADAYATYYASSDKLTAFRIHVEKGGDLEQEDLELYGEYFDRLTSPDEVEDPKFIFRCGELTTGCNLVNGSYQYLYETDGTLTETSVSGFSYSEDDVLEVTGDDLDDTYLFIGELYNDFSENDSRYGGLTDYAVRNNTFIPLGNVTALDGASELTAYAGDTYFQRWDCQKTCKWSDEAENNINEFVSVMLETYHNIEGRYDIRRGLLNNQATTPENSNLFNGAYDNLGTLFSGNVLDEKYSLDEHPAQLTWTLDKTPGADVDSWTNVTLASVLDLDGSKGPLEALRTHANSIFAFQDRGIAEVLFNTRTQLSTTEGVPVEIANSGRVDGKRYVTERNGCRDKWSIGVTKGGLWFADGVNGTIKRVAQQVEDVSTRKGMSVWTRARCGTGIWDPVEYGAFAAFADTTRDEVYFCRPMDGDRLDAVCFSEVLDEFTSFHGYGALSAMFNVGDRLLAFRDAGDGESGMWLQGEGRHGELFGELQDWYVQFRVAPDPYGDKTFTNLEYRADVFDMSEPNPYMEGEGRLTGRTFDSLRVWDEYQGNEVALRFDALRDAYPDTRRLNRIWRTDIPRARRGEDNPFGLNRIRNPWVWLRLTGTTPEEGDYMMNFHDLTVKYIE